MLEHIWRDSLELKDTWQTALTRLRMADAIILSESPYDPSRRTYLHQGKVFKILIVNQDRTSNLRQQDFLGEYNILKRCVNIRGVSNAIEYFSKNGLDVLVLSKSEGSAASDLTLGLFQFLMTLVRLTRTLLKLSRLGIAHNDISPANVLINPQGQVCLIDFDQATITGWFPAMARNFVGLRIGQQPVQCSLLGFVRKRIFPTPPRWAVMVLKRILRRMRKEQDWQVLEARVSPMPHIPENASSKLRLVDAAWRIARKSAANSPGADIAYYAIDFEGVHFPGEREWSDRWRVLKGIAEVRSKRVLELGCNLALLSCHVLKEGGASAGLAVDCDADILRGAKNLADAYEVPLELRQIDFDDPTGWEDELSAFEPDVVFALSVLNWVGDKQRFMEFLGRFREAVFEGHDEAATEIRRFRAVGFDHVVQVGLSERHRPILHCKKGELV